MTKAFVVPQAGRVVPDPARQDVIPKEGRAVKLTQYWHRRIADCDVVVQASPKKTVTKTKEP